MKKVFIFISLVISTLIANECILNNQIELLSSSKNNFKIIDKTFLLKSNRDEQLLFYYEKSNKLKLVKYRGFGSISSLEINYYFENSRNLLVKIIKTNYTDFVGSKVSDIFSTQVISFPLCGRKNFSHFNYNNLKDEYELAWRIRDLGKF